MSKAPNWLDKAETNTSGNTVGDDSTLILSKKLKPGRKPSLIKRKVVGISISDKQKEILDDLEFQLKVNGINLTRGKSESAELAINLLCMILKNHPEGTDRWVTKYLRDMQKEGI
ncbi:hypothetical protein Sps_04672 [Shewanella psychrophila]|uniref:Uncharacterized protein n=1 Tax=Shewanella psychrophila TaxID=225848 RepID=A0A1S6HW18_9GAMM|nr:hypothetical protein [Shewanella psychrophila]AQS39755.1 hypothetical protein Sps_04672 [Shewanella psychrophila]